MKEEVQIRKPKQKNCKLFEAVIAHLLFYLQISRLFGAKWSFPIQSDDNIVLFFITISIRAKTPVFNLPHQLTVIFIFLSIFFFNPFPIFYLLLEYIFYILSTTENIQIKIFLIRFLFIIIINITIIIIIIIFFFFLFLFFFFFFSILFTFFFFF